MIVTDAAFPYLVAQKGKLDPLKGERAAWERAYRAALAETYGAIAPHLPQTCQAILDVGGGMGGIDVLLNQHFGGDVEVCILDGIDDPPVMTRHADTFSNMAVAKAFLEANGVRQTSFVAPDLQATPRVRLEPFDLVVSFGSWCFHYAPETYLALVRRVVRPGGRVIVEVRRGRPGWMAALCDAFGPAALISRSEKYDRLAFSV